MAEPLPPVPQPEEGELPAVVAELRDRERIAEGPWSDDPQTAAAAGLRDFDADAGEGIAETIDYQRRTYVLFTAPGNGPEYTYDAQRGTQRFMLWLARLEHDAADERWRRHSAVRLAERVIDTSGAEPQCTVATELRARDLDDDGEVEITVLSGMSNVLVPEEECGALGYLVGGDDLNVQARFTREYRFFHTGADGDTRHDRNTAWQIRDQNADGHADLHVTERWTFTDDFAGDWGGESVGTIPGSHARAHDSAEIDCLYDAASDAWPCPEVPHPIGVALLRPYAEPPSRPW